MGRTFRLQSVIVRTFGVVLLLVGSAAAAIGPAEWYAFYLFGEGGPFHYEGFALGSLMFAYIAIQIAGYYVIALLLIPLGWGNLRMRPWARPLTEAYCWLWLVFGLPLTLVGLFMYITSKDPSVAAAAVALFVAFLIYPVLPGTLVRLYRSSEVRQLFSAKDSAPSKLESIPQPLLILAGLCIFHVIALHLVLLLNGLFPFFGVLLTGLRGVLVADVIMLSLVILCWGVVRARMWAWWGASAVFALLVVTTITTLPRYAVQELAVAMNLPASEMGFLEGVPIGGLHISIFFIIPLLVSLVVTIGSRRAFLEQTEEPGDIHG